MHKYHQIIIKIKHLLQRYPREYYIFAFFCFFLFFIISKLFSFTVINSEYYKSLALKQQTSKTVVQVSRGNIYSVNDKGNVLATSVDLDDLAVDPSIEGNKNKLNDFLTNVIYSEICYLKSNNLCRNSLQKFIGVLDLADFKNNEIYIKEKITSKLKEILSRTKVTSVLLKDDLSVEQSFELEKMKLTGVYINGTNLYVNPEEVVDEEFIVNKISVITKDKVEDMKYLIRKRELKYLPLLSKISITTSENIKQKLSEEKEAFSRGFISKEDLVGSFIILTPNGHRYYPENDMAGTVLGFVDSEGVGKYGIEGYFNDVLKGKASNTYSKKDIMGRLIEPMTLEDETNLAGANITLTIDRNIQKAVEDIVDRDIDEYRANSISVVIMDPKTGAVIAMATNPRFNPNNPGEAYELERVTYSKYPNPSTDLLGARVLAIDNTKGTEYIYDSKRIYLREISREELGDQKLDKYVFINKKGGGIYKNDMIQDLYEPGSIFKPIVFAAAIDSGDINRYDMYQDNGFVQIDNFKIKNVSKQCIGYNTFQNAMNYSCNVGMIKIAQKIGASIFYKYIDLFGIGKKTGITLEGEVYGRLDPYEKWSKAQLFTSSFGQGITTTVLQMASVYSVIANGGIYYKPQIVKSIEFADGKKIVNKSEATHRVIKESTSKTMIKVLVDSVEHGVAKNGAVKGYSIAGKTGTAQIAYKGKYESGEASTMGFYAGFAPAEDPKFVMIVKIERSRSSIYGGETVAKTFSKIAQYLFNYYGIPPKSGK
ncbi:MAG: penicillin-binding protein 2 [Candidatus Gracilibacteria bacterium]|nr:penicillin-binding protein 2 [Candidatus Gracilibacteria bacterium]